MAVQKKITDLQQSLSTEGTDQATILRQIRNEERKLSRLDKKEQVCKDTRPSPTDALTSAFEDDFPPAE